MSKNLNKKLLAEAFDSLVNDNDIAKATRLMKRHLNLVAQEQYQLLESEDEDFEVTDMGDDFNNEVAAEAGSDDDERFEQVQIAIDELEDKFPTEMTEDIESKFDELRNIVDELKLVEEGDGDEVSVEDANVIIEDLKADFEMAGEISDEVNDLFDEISSGLQGEDAVEEVDVEDDDSEFDLDDEEETEDEETVEECGNSKPLDESDDTDVDLTFEDEEESKDGDDKEELDVDVDSDDTDVDLEDDKEESEDTDDELVYDIKSDAEELLAKIEELEARDGGEEVTESFEKIADPRKKASSEDEGVEKKRTMNFGKMTGMTLKKGSDLMNGKASKGDEPSKSTKQQPIAREQNAKGWKKTEKPANKPASGKSVLGN